MAYDIFSQLQGPQVDVNLFPQAFSAGVNAGNALPTQLTSGIQGFIKGVQQGQQIALTQGQIEQAPLDAEAKRIANERNQIQLQNEKDLEVNQLEADRAKLLDDRVKFDEDHTTRAKAQQFQEAFQAADPLTRKNMIFSGEYADVFSADPNKYKFAVQSVSEFLDDSDIRKANFALGKYNTSNYYDKQVSDSRNKLDVINSQLRTDDSIQNAAARSNLTPEDVPYKVEVVPSGKYEYDENDNVIFDDATKEKKVSEDYVTGTKPTAYDFIYKGKRVQEDVAPELAKQIKAARGLQGYVDNSYKTRALNKIDQNERAVQSVNSRRQAQDVSLGGAQSKQLQSGTFEPEADSELPVDTKVRPNPNALFSISAVPLVNSKTKQINLSQNPQAYKVAQQTVGLPNEDFDKVKPQFRTIFQNIELGPQGWFGSYSAAQGSDISDAKKDISDYTSEKEFETTPSLKDKYTDQAVTDHNEKVDQFEQMLDNPFSDGMAAAATIGSMDVSQLVRVNSPLELYQLSQSKSKNELLDTFISRYQDHLKKTKLANEKSRMISGAMLSILNSNSK